MADIAEPLTSYTADKNELRRALESMRVSYGAADWDTALTLAAAGASGAENFSIIMISDGGVGEAASLPANIPQPIYLPVGESANNIAITALATRGLAGGAPQLFAQVTNYGDSRAEISLVIRLNDVLRLSRSGAIPPRSQLPIPFNEPISEPFETLSATLTFDNDVEDFLELDNRAWDGAKRSQYAPRLLCVLGRESIPRASAAQPARRADLPRQRRKQKLAR